MTFHIPNQFRIRKGFMASTEANGNNGAFFIPSYPGKAPFKVVASDGGLEDGQIAWEHVSVSLLIRRSLVRAQVGEPKFSSEINGLCGITCGSDNHERQPENGNSCGKPGGSKRHERPAQHLRMRLREPRCARVRADA